MPERNEVTGGRKEKKTTEGGNGRNGHHDSADLREKVNRNWEERNFKKGGGGGKS